MEKGVVLISGTFTKIDSKSRELYENIISLIDKEKYYIYSPLDTMRYNGSDVEIYERAMSLLFVTNIMIAEVSNASTDQGMEIQEANRLGIPVLAIAKKGSNISSLIKGNPCIKNIVYYENIKDINNIIIDFINEYQNNRTI